MFTKTEQAQHLRGVRFRMILLTTTFVGIVQLNRQLNTIAPEAAMMETTATAADNNNTMISEFLSENQQHNMSNNNYNTSASAVTAIPNTNNITTFPEFSSGNQERASHNSTSATAVQQVSLLLDNQLIDYGTALGSFPRWDNETGIALAPLLRFMEGVLNQTESAFLDIVGQDKEGKTMDPKETFHAETIYVVDAQGVHASATTRSRTSRG